MDPSILFLTWYEVFNTEKTHDGFQIKTDRLRLTTVLSRGQPSVTLVFVVQPERTCMKGIREGDRVRTQSPRFGSLGLKRDLSLSQLNK